ncbi:RNA-binding protein CP33, chloroplastic isoform X1 [Actinidia eriantha]|uniref:RNA-binding protein CP33, chloroplastic isoform X1 n=1 Tax=Actinidia eriantha TaxID=165200 RepID=UPI00258D8650|nr:RNA-binding protein CP33, chloroplastic isoform X1 [Actinidia eriantha]
MAFVRLLCFSSTSQISTQQFLFCSQTNLRSSLPKPSQFNTSLFSHISPLCLSSSQFPLSHRTQKPNPFLFTASSSAQVTIETPEITESETVAEEEDEASRTRVLAQNVPWTSTVDDIRLLFGKFGTVVDVELSMHNKTRNRGLAFVSMGSHEEALAALENLESSEFEGRTLRLTWARSIKKKPNPVAQPKPVPIHNLFVANLPYQARAKDLKELFNSENANVVTAEIIFHENPRRSSGYGFVSFNTKQEAEAALSAFQGKTFMGRQIRVARSKKFLRQETKANIEFENALQS